MWIETKEYMDQQNSIHPKSIPSSNVMNVVYSKYLEVIFWMEVDEFAFKEVFD